LATGISWESGVKSKGKPSIVMPYQIGSFGSLVDVIYEKLAA
jgi:hypothetical protein